MNALTTLASTSSAVTLTVAAASKLKSRDDFVEFAIAMGQFGITRKSFAFVTAVAVVTLELLLSAGLVAGFWSESAARISLLATSALIAGFTGAVIRASRRNSDFECRCFGSGDTTNVPLHSAANLSLVVLVVLGALTASRDSDPGSILFSFGLGLLLGSAVVAAPVIYDTFRLAPIGSINRRPTQQTGTP